MLQQLILEEVIIRREANLKAFHRWMRVLEISDRLQEYSHLLRPLFVAEEHAITASQCKGLIKSERPF